MPKLPEQLKKDADTRWRMITEAFEGDGLDQTLLTAEQELLKWSLPFSDYVTRQLARHPDLLVDLIQSGDLKAEYAATGHRQRLADLWQRQFAGSLLQWPAGDPAAAGTAVADIDKEAVMTALRIFRRREMVRIALRDMGGRADLNQTLADLSHLADTALAAALDYLYGKESIAWGVPKDKQGNPMQMVVLGLGKLGARELNFSSDVDLMFTYATDGQTSGGERGTTTHDDFFTRLCRGLVQLIGASTADGFVFRVDTRLRPFGDSGPLVMSFDRLEDYYQVQGREWERYALIKARTVAGDIQSGAKIIERLRPFVYRRYLDYGTFDGLRDMKGRIAREVKSKGLEDNVKLGPGGIREIEFFGQMFQLIRGGVAPELQIRPIRQVLRVLVQEQYIPAQVGTTMDEAYVFLRMAENRIQQWDDQQTHQLPETPLEQLRLAASLGFEDWQQFIQHLDQHRTQVHTHFDELLASDKKSDTVDPRAETAKQLERLWREEADSDALAALLNDMGYASPEEVVRQIKNLKEDRSLRGLSPVGRDRLKRLVPLVVMAVGPAEQPELVLGRIFDIIRSIQQRTSYLALLLENPSILTHLVRLAGASPWIATFLSRHPVLLDELLDPRTLFKPPQRDTLKEELTHRLAGIDPEDLEYQMEAMRVFKQANVLRVAASDITHVLPLMKVSDRLSDIAEEVLAAAVHLCFEQLQEKYGAPACSLGQTNCERGFAVIAYGKLGGLELGYGSDLDMVFLHAASPGSTSGGERSLDNTQFFSRLGQRVLHLLTTHTAAGILYEADMRLRPSGSSGMLVSHIDGFAAYQENDAWTWEHQALIRARAIVGDPALQEKFNRIRHETLTRPRDTAKLKTEVADMRERLRKEHTPDSANQFDIKQGAGGIMDIEFLVQYLVLAHAHANPALVRWTDNVRLLQSLNETGVLGNTTAFRLRRAYLLYRAMVHRLNLAQKPAVMEDDRFAQPRQFVIETWQRFLGN